MECLFAALLWENRVRAVPGRFLKTMDFTGGAR